jgi:hypothetical protein
MDPLKKTPQDNGVTTLKMKIIFKESIPTTYQKKNTTKKEKAEIPILPSSFRLIRWWFRGSR